MTDRDLSLDSETTESRDDLSLAGETQIAQATSEEEQVQSEDTQAEETEAAEGEEQPSDAEEGEAAIVDAPPADAPPGSVAVNRPAPGQTIEIETLAGQRYVINFDPTEAQVQIDGNDFILVFDDGGRVVFDNLISLAQDGNAPILRVGGTDIGGDVIVGQALALTGQQTTLETAAGPEAGTEAEGGGGTSYSDNFGNIIDTLNAQPDIPYVFLDFGLTDLEVIDLDPLEEDEELPPLPSLFATPGFAVVTEQYLPPRSPEGSDFDNTIVESSDPDDPGIVFNGQVEFSPGAFPQQVQAEGLTGTPLAAPETRTVDYDGFSYSLDGEIGDIFLTLPDGSLFLLRSDGSFVFVLADNSLEHTNTSGSGADDALDFLAISYTVGTTDGRTAIGEIGISLWDDGPEANQDVATIPTGATSASGNVLDNDELGADGSELTAIVLGGMTYELNGMEITVTGDAGELIIAPDGNYTYNAFTPIPPGGVSDSFDYILTDNDGDTDMSSVDVDFKPVARPNTPDTNPEDTVVTEDADPDGSNFNQPSVDGNILANDTSGSDGFASVPISEIDFVSGVDVGDVTKDDTTFPDRVIFTYTPSGTTDPVWQLTVFIDTTDDGMAGDYEFNLLLPFDHPTADGANSAFMNFTYTIEDLSGDMASAEFVIQIVDDVPIAVDDPVTIDQSQNTPTAQGNVLDNDDLGADVVTTVTNIEGNGSSSAVAGSTVLQGAWGELTINPDGSYSYSVNQPIGPNDTPVDTFTYTITDDDGDTATANLTLEFGINAKDDGPGTDNENAPVIEDGAPDGTFIPTSVSENLLDNDNPGSDGYGTPPITDATFTGTYPATVTKDTSNPGQIVFTSDDGVWRMTIDTATGDYTFDLLDRYDHDPLQGNNDAFQSFGYTIQDGDGDTASASVTIQIVDDVPVANPDVGDLDLKSGVTTIVGNARANDDQGGDSAVVDQLEGIAVPLNDPLLFQGTYGLIAVSRDGTYSYTINRDIPENTPLDESFVYRLIDEDGDVSTSTITIDFSLDAKDDGNPDPNDESTLVVEDGLPDGTFLPDSFSDNLLDNDVQGSDGLAAEPITAIEWTGNYVGGVNDPTPANVGGTFTVESADGVWTLVVDATTGDYTFTLNDNYDHDANDSNGSDVFDVQTFDYTVTDANGDTDVAQLTVGIKDDTPIAADDVDQVTAGNTVTMVMNLDVSGSMGFDFAGNNPPQGETRLDAAIDAVKQALESFVGEGFGPTTQIRFQPFNNSFPLSGARAPAEFGPSDFETYSAGDAAHPINVYLDGLFAEGNTQFEPVMNQAALYLSDDSNQSDFNLLYHVSDGADNDGYDPTFGLIPDLYSGSIPNLEIFAFGLGAGAGAQVDFDELDAIVTGIEPGDPGNDIGDKTDGDPSNDENPENVALAESGGDLADLFLDTLPEVTITGNVRDNDDQGGDTALVSSVEGNSTSGGPIQVVGSFGTLTIQEDGTYTYEVNLPGPQNGGIEEFDYILTDSDGDTDPATLTIVINSPLLTLDDGPGTTNDPGLVIEDGPGDGTFTPTSISDNVLDNDQPGSVPFAAQAIVGLTFTGSYTGASGTETVNPAVFNAGDNTFTITTSDGVWNLVVDATNGDYTFSLDDRFENTDGGFRNVDTLTFNYTVEDQNGDQSTAELRVGIEDDVPVAVDDIGSVSSGGNTATGNVLTNDDQGGDSAVVTQVNGVDIGGTFLGNFGNLVMAANGDYSYTLNGPVPTAGATDTFTYTILDEDGDTSTATLTVGIEGPPNAENDGPGTDNENDLVIESDNPPGSGTFQIAIIADNVLDNDTPGSNPLASEPISAVSYSGPQPAGQIARFDGPTSVTFDFQPDGAGTEPVWSITIYTQDDGVNQAGDYSFVLRRPFDHTIGGDGETFDESFDYTIIDTEGGTDSATLTVRIVDDVPVAIDDNEALTGQVQAGSTVGGNVRDNDDQGGDSAIVTAVDGQTVNEVGTTQITGAFGILTIESDGDFSYEVTDPNLPDGPSEAFTYTLTDTDGDTSTAVLTIGTGLNTRDDGFQTDNDPGLVVENGPGDGSFTPTSVSDNVLDNDQLGSDPLATPPIVDIIYTGSYLGGVTRTPSADGFDFASNDGVWRLEVNTTTGAYTFFLDQQYDHAGDQGPNLAFETFSYTVETADGSDSDSATLTVAIQDDIPVAVDDAFGIAENQSSVNGNILANDDQGGDSATVTSLGGQLPGATVSGTFGEITVDAAGNFVYTVTATNLPQSGVSEVFAYQITDVDGDVSSAFLRIGTDPDANDDGPLADPNAQKVIEDGPGDGSFTPTSISDNVLANDVLGSSPLADPPITDVVYTGGYPGGVTKTAITGGFEFASNDGVWRLEINTTTGDYTFFLDQRLDHLNVQGNNENIQTFNYTISDEAQEANSTAQLSVAIVDDVPVATNDVAELDANATQVTGNVTDNDDLGGDDSEVTAVNGQSIAAPIAGNFGLLTMGADGEFTYTVTVATLPQDGVSESFTYTLTDSDGDTSTALLDIGTGLDARDDGPLADPNAELVVENGPGDGSFTPTSVSDNVLDNDTLGSDPLASPPITDVVYTGSYPGGVTRSDTVDGYLFSSNDGAWRLEINTTTGAYTFFLDDNYPHATAMGANTAFETFDYTIAEAGPGGQSDTAELSIGIVDDVPVAVDDEVNLTSGASEVSDNVLTNDDQGGDGATVTEVEGQSVGGSPITVAGTFGDLVIGSDGGFTYTVTAASLPQTGAAEAFTYEITDSDGDVSTAILRIGTDPDARNDGPLADPNAEKVIEDGPGDGTFTPTSVSDNVLANDVFGSDPLATPPITDVVFNGGYPGGVSRSPTADGFEFQSNDGVWRLQINTTTGAYTFFLDQRFDHDAIQGNNEAPLTFDYTISDAAGEASDTATLSVVVVDDIPVAVDDSAEISQSTFDASGNVLTNDDQGGDDSDVTAVNGQGIGGPIAGTFGDLTIDADGNFSYTVTVDPNTLPPQGVSENFTYTITDTDGDTSTAVLTIGTGLDARDDGPLADPTAEKVIENGPGDGTFTPTSITDNVLDNDTLGSDPLASPPITDVVYTGSYPGGVTRTTTADGFQFASDDGVWRLQINTTTGEYTFFLDQRLDHANIQGANEAFETFEYTIAEAAPGTDSDTAQLSVAIVDDVPVAVDDVANLAPNQTQVNANVLTNDDQGGDGAVVTEVAGQAVGGSPITVAGAFGDLVIGSDGDFTYTVTAANLPQTGASETFQYTITDQDGDISTAFLRIGTDPDAKNDGPLADPNAEKVIEDGPGDGTFTPTSVSDNVLDNDVFGSDPLADPPIINVVFNGGYPGGVSRTSTADGFEFQSNDGVWRLQINTTTGAYTFFLDQRFDHDAIQGNNEAPLTFDYTISDEAGEASDTATLSVVVVDDVPVAVDDEAELNQATLDVLGNVLTNDDQGGDAAEVTSVNGSGIGSPIGGTFGDLTIDADGNFSYTVTVDPNTLPPEGVSESFTYTITDSDGDTSSATLEIGTGLDARDDGPGTGNDPGFVIEDGLPDGTFLPTSITDNVLDNDTVGSDPLASPPITDVVYTGSYPGGVTRTSTPDGFEFQSNDGVWRMEINTSTGEYTFFLDQRYDHDNVQGTNDAFETFDYTIEEAAPGIDSDTAQLTIGIRDDIPVAEDDCEVLAVPEQSFSLLFNLDVSGSMAWTFDSNQTPGPGEQSRLEVAIEAIKVTLEEYVNRGHDDTTKVTFNPFAGTYPLSDPRDPITFDDLDGYSAGNNAHPINAYLNSLFADGATQYEGVMDNAADYFGNLANQREFNILYFVSDGGDNNGYDPTAGDIQDLYDGSLPLEIFAFGLGDDGATDVDPDELDAVVSGIPDGDPGNTSGVIDNPDRVLLVQDPNDVAGLFLDTIPGAEISGNVILNDDQGGDGAVVSEVAGQSTAGGPITVNGTYGVLEISEDGSYTYTVTQIVPENGTVQEVFDYQLTDADGDLAAAQLKIDLFVPQQVLVVGSNEDDTPSAPSGNPNFDHRVPNENDLPDNDGPIEGENGSDVLVGDIGGIDTNFIPAAPLNIAMILDTSGSMNDDSGTPGLTRAELQGDATQNLLQDLADFAAAEGTEINIYLQPFATHASFDNDSTFNNPAAVIQFDGSTIRFATFNPNTSSQPGTIPVSSLAAIFAYIDQLDIGGRTNYEDGIRQGVEWMADQVAATSDDYINKFFFLSDGNPNQIGDFNDNDSVSASEALDSLNDPTDSDYDWPANESFLDMFNGTGTFSGGNNVDISAIGIGDGVTESNLDAVDNTGGAEIVNTADELQTALEGGFEEPGDPIAVGGDVLNGFEGDDVLFGDVLNTDQLATDLGLDKSELPDGSGWEVFQKLIDDGVISLNDAKAYISNPANWAALNAGSRGEGDTLDGGAGDDALFGQGGGDTLIGGLGDDLIDGGNDSDSDVFVFSLGTGGFGSDTLTNFDSSTDVLRFEDVVDVGPAGPDIGDVDAAISDFVTNGSDVTVNFNDGSSITIENGNPGGSINSIADLVDNVSQIEVDVS